MAEISKTADQALTVLLEVGESGPVTPAVLARSLGMNRTVVHRLLSTLHQRGFITRQENGYVPGAILVRIADHVQPELRSQGRRVMRELSDLVGETVVMHIPDGEDAVVLDQVVSDRNIVRVEHEIGSRHTLVQGASGRAILAFLSPQVVDRITRKLDNADGIRRQLEGVRQLGYSLSHDELQQGVHGLAVPVLDDTGVAVASLAILVPVTRANNLTEHTDALLESSAGLSRALSGAHVAAR
ncbi:IclR family transcriptional regulator [Capillimicrobium parvum]|uniref:HTH-type transcriptional regulator KipR n=1 Tax=Capillimicrobium parvum TaxID=2884022 RepID=A0A9E6XZC2_9ACTN|nr:IclR family transcriptional regulator [Capillimicrobium parvum]UGS37322.1 HTH-type transcriptional regulator KipR [Capillimicrobium parvum]